MQEKPLKKLRSLLQREIQNNTNYFNPVVRNGWVIKFSVLRESNILVTVFSRYTGQTIIRYYVNEVDAVSFINMIISLDPMNDHQLA